MPGVIFETIVLFKTAREHISGAFKKFSSVSLKQNLTVRSKL